MAIFLKTGAGVKYDGTRQLHDLPVDLYSKWLRRAKIPNTGGAGGFKRTCMELLTGFVNQLPKPDPKNPAHSADLRYRQGIIPDLMHDATSLNPQRTMLKFSEAAQLPT